MYSDTGKPFSASSSAGVTTCSKVIVPYFSRAVSQASTAAGITVRSIPVGIWPPACLLK